MMKACNVRYLFPALLVLALGASTASADLILTLDPTTETATISGTDSGNIGTALGGYIRWTGSVSGMPNGVSFPDFIANPATDAPVQTTAGVRPAYGHFRTFSGGAQLEFRNFVVTGSQSLESTGISFSYSYLSAAARASISLLDGATLPVQASGDMNGWNSVTIEIAAIPEPTSIVLVVIGVAGLCVMRRRRRR